MHQRGGEQAAPDPRFDRNRFPGNGRLINRRMPADDPAVYWDPGTRAADHHISPADLVGGDFDLGSLPLKARNAGREFEQFAQGPARPVRCGGFHYAPILMKKTRIAAVAHSFAAIAATTPTVIRV